MLRFIIQKLPNKFSLAATTKLTAPRQLLLLARKLVLPSSMKVKAHYLCGLEKVSFLFGQVLWQLQ